MQDLRCTLRSSFCGIKQLSVFCPCKINFKNCDFDQVIQFRASKVYSGVSELGPQKLNQVIWFRTTDHQITWFGLGPPGIHMIILVLRNRFSKSPCILHASYNSILAICVIWNKFNRMRFRTSWILEFIINAWPYLVYLDSIAEQCFKWRL